MIAALSIAAFYLLLAGYAAWQQTGRTPAENWLVATCGASAALMALYTLIMGRALAFQPPLTASYLTATGFALVIGLTAMLTMVYIEVDRRLTLGIGVIIAAWIAAVAITGLIGLPPAGGLEPWADLLLTSELTLAGEIALAGWAALALALLALTWRAFLRTRLPMYANRVLIWVFIAPALLFGHTLGAWMAWPWYLAGYAIALAGTIGAVYSLTVERIINLRELIRTAVTQALLAILSFGVVLGAIAVVLFAPVEDIPSSDAWAVAVGAALAAAIVLTPLLQIARQPLRRLAGARSAEPTEAMRLYTRRIQEAIELEGLAEASISALKDLFKVRRGALILATVNNDAVILESIGREHTGSAAIGKVPTGGLLYKHLVEKRAPLLQYDIDYQRQFVSVTAEERDYFKDLRMDIYAPIVADEEMVGLLALGPKANDAPYRQDEIDLLEMLANQTIAALKIARLVTDLRDLNRRITALNEGLRTTNERLERLDAVKSDFLAIASHELRTPLTQIQGSAELMLDMTADGTLDAGEMTSLLKSLSRASRRMGDVIGALLDVTMIDVESMDLEFGDTAIAEVVKRATEPYAGALAERDQTLVARGLGDLPPVKADANRLVRAFENLITNAIKFTPDGGRIDITGQVYEKDSEGRPLSVRITVADTGIGIDQAHHSLIFEKFFRVGSVRLHSSGITKYKGAGPGLGLPITKGIIDGHGGRIWVNSPAHDEETCPGSTFHVVLPVTPPAIAIRRRIQQIQASKEDTIIRPAPENLLD
jgi:signal transduction histidine kinase